jgi:hypothetical protein
MSVNQVFAWVASAAAVVVVLVGLYLSGPPNEQRMLRLDARRVQDLQALARSIDAYRNENSALPETLEELIVGQRLSNMPVDPVSGDTYAYESTGANRYRLCTDFDRPSPESETSDFWEHESGTQCFMVVARRSSTPPFRPPAPQLGGMDGTGGGGMDGAGMGG